MDYTEAPGVLEAPDERRARSTARTLVFTSAQSNTKLHEPFFNALLHYCSVRNAELHISRYTYNKSAFANASVKPDSKEASDDDALWYDPRIMPYVSDESLEITPDLVWCGELNIMPTAARPLTRFRTYTRRASSIIPHAKMAMESVPTMKDDPTKFLYTTGTVTLRNYIQKAAGQIAEFHHVFGALVVEVDHYGHWWARQLNADKTGRFYDLDREYTPEGKMPRERVHAITHGDIHGCKLNADVARAMWGTKRSAGAVDVLEPHEQHFHDTVDFTPRNHHNIDDPHFMHDTLRNGNPSVEAEFSAVGKFLGSTAFREWSQHYIIVSNHDQAVLRWLKNPAAASDPENALFWHKMNAKCYEAQERGERPRPFRDALRRHLSHNKQPRFTFVHEDESHRIVGDIECGLHGHLGPNGASGTPKNLAVIGKANTGHTHSAGIVDGVYTAGVYGELDMGYNKGPSSWSHSAVLTYRNGKRAIITFNNGKFWR